PSKPIFQQEQQTNHEPFPSQRSKAISTVSTSRKRHPWALSESKDLSLVIGADPLSLGSGKFLCATSPLPAWRPVVPIIIRCGTPSCDSENHGAILPSDRIGSARNLGIQTGPNGRLPLDLLGAASTFAIV